MRITYSPDGGEPHVYVYDSDDLLMGEVRTLESTAGAGLDVVEANLQAGSYTERLLVLWVLMRREDPKVKLAHLEQTVRKGEVKVEYDRAERAKMRDLVSKSPALTDEDKAAVIATLDADDDAETLAQLEAAEPGPKDPALP